MPLDSKMCRYMGGYHIYIYINVHVPEESFRSFKPLKDERQHCIAKAEEGKHHEPGQVQDPFVEKALVVQVPMPLS